MNIQKIPSYKVIFGDSWTQNQHRKKVSADSLDLAKSLARRLYPEFRHLEITSITRTDLGKIFAENYKQSHPGKKRGPKKIAIENKVADEIMKQIA